MPSHMPMPKSCPGPECPGCSSPKCMAEGGSVDSWTKRSDHEKGINKAALPTDHRLRGETGRSQAGAALHPAHSVHEDIDKHAAKRVHEKTLGEMRAMKKPNLMAEGGEIEPGMPMDDEGDEELKHAMGSELHGAIQRKDHKGIHDCIEAIVLSMKGKH